jgi:hypothetical protein
MKPLIFCLFLLSCGAAYTPQVPITKLPVAKVVHDTVAVKKDTIAAPPIVKASTPDDVYLQNIIDSCIKNSVTYYYLPSKRYYLSHPLIMASWGGTYYRPFTLVLDGTGKFAGTDGTGTIFDFSAMTSGFGIGIQGGKGSGIIGIKLIGAFKYKFPGAHSFYNTSLSEYTDSVCRDTRYSPYFAIVVDPFGPAAPPDGGYPGLSAYYRGSRNGSTGTVIEDCFITNWVGGIITSPNGSTQNADITLVNKIQFANMKVCVAGCQDQEKMNRVSNVMAWGVIHTCFVTGMYGAGSVGNW